MHAGGGGRSRKGEKNMEKLYVYVHKNICTCFVNERNEKMKFDPRYF